MSSKEMVISANRHETRVALLEDDQLVEVYFQRANEYSLAGSIHKGRVTRVLPGMQSAFVDLGLERDTFLYVSDFLEEHDDIDRVTGDERAPRGERERDRGRGPMGRRQPQPQPAPAPLEGGPAAGTETGAEGGEPTASAAAAERSPQGGEERGERRGRRSRRRRNRGRGFPENKYAPAPAAAGSSAAAEPELEEPLGERAEGQAGAGLAPLILPGESLAKYRAASPEPPTESAFGVEANGDLTAEPAVEGEAGPEPEAETEYDEPIHYPPENALPDAPAHHAEAGAGQSYAEPAAAAAGEPPVEAELAGEPGEDSGPAVAPLLDEDEDRDIQAMILGEVEGEIDALEEEIEAAAQTPEDAESETPSPAAVEPGVEAGLAEAAPAGEESGSAEVRERGGRYPHRVSRRMRRRMRGQHGQPAEPQEGAPGAAPAAAPVAERTRPATPGRAPGGPTPSITDLLKEGQEIIVQIAKEPLGQKGARITSHVALPGRYVVYMPTLEHMGVSRKIASDEERLRLKRILQGRRPGPVGGFITRTAAEGRSEDEIAADMEFLYKLWQDIKAKAERKPAPALLHHDLDIVQRVLRDQLTDSFKAIWIDNEEVYENTVRFVERFQPALVSKVKLYTREAPIFDAFGITSELEKALRPKVWLKSGGYIVINQTEALVAIDVNTGKFVGKSNRLEDTIVKTNTEAIKEIVRQIRLRDLGGIIVIDFIDMDERKNRQKVMQALEEALRADRAPSKVLSFNDFGLVALTRKRVKQSLERTLGTPCPYCSGVGLVKSVTTMCNEIYAEARKMAKEVEREDLILRVNPEVAKALKAHGARLLTEMETMTGKAIAVKADPLVHQEQFEFF